MEPNPQTNPYQVGSEYQHIQQPSYVDTGTDSTGGIIPYKNPHALIAYYLGLFSLFPILGFFLAVPAFILGVIGLRNRNRNPKIRGSAHAWIGIVMGALMTLLWGGMTLLMIAVAIFAE